DECLPQLIELAESAKGRRLRGESSAAVVEMVVPMGRKARADKDLQGNRGPVISRLSNSVKTFYRHKNQTLVEAFLLASRASDGELRRMTDQPGKLQSLLIDTIKGCDHPGISELLAEFIRRRELPEMLSETIAQRPGPLFRDALLRVIGHEPPVTVYRNLTAMGVPASCKGGEETIVETTPDYRAALIRLHVAASGDKIGMLHMIAEALERSGPGVVKAATFAFQRCEVPSLDFWLRASGPVADGDSEAIARHSGARLLNRLINLLDHENDNLVRSIRRVLGPLHAESMLSRFASLKPESRERLGKVVMLVDSDAIQHIRDCLRHPVLDRRLEAIAATNAMAVVDLMSDALSHIALQDHQEARMRAAEALRYARGESTLKTLQSLTAMPPSPIRDIAEESLRIRNERSGNSQIAPSDFAGTPK
ncbi:MAG: hypothetical protein AAGA03_12120, partial [Planctomycetota bacterium]